MVLEKDASHAEAEELCRNQYGSTLAHILDYETLTGVSHHMHLLITERHLPVGKHGEVWIWGRTNESHNSFINLQNQPPPNNRGKTTSSVLNTISS